MELLGHYSTSDSEESSNHDNSRRNQHKRLEHQKEDETKCKKKRRITNCDSNNNDDDTTSRTLNKAEVTILSSPKERIHLEPNHAFERNHPHIHGNWSGNIYISLRPNMPSALTATAVSFEGRNSNSYEQFKRFAYSTIMDFGNRIGSMSTATASDVGNSMCGRGGDKTTEIADSNIDGNTNTTNNRITIVPHLNMNEVKKYYSDESSMSTDENSSDGDSEKDSDVDEGGGVCNNSDSEKDDDDDYDDDIGLHISLAKPFYLQKQSIQPFLNDLKQRLSLVQNMMSVQFDINHNSSIESRSIMSSSASTSTTDNSCWEILANDNKTRSFLTIPVCSSNNKDRFLKELISIIDPIMIKYGLDCYYANPKFHCSIASWKGQYDWMPTTSSVTEGRRDDEGVPCVNVNKNVTGNNIEKRSNGRTGQGILTFIIRGVHCDFGTVEKHFIEFGCSKPL